MGFGVWSCTPTAGIIAAGVEAAGSPLRYPANSMRHLSVGGRPWGMGGMPKLSAAAADSLGSGAPISRASRPYAAARPARDNTTISCTWGRKGAATRR